MVIPEDYLPKLLDLLGTVTTMVWNLLFQPASALVVLSTVLVCGAFLVARRKGIGVWERSGRISEKGSTSDLPTGQCSTECERSDKKMDESLPPEYRGILWNKQTLNALTWLKNQTRRI